MGDGRCFTLTRQTALGLYGTVKREESYASLSYIIELQLTLCFLALGYLRPVTFVCTRNRNLSAEEKNVLFINWPVLGIEL